MVPLCSSSHVYPSSSGWDGRFHHHQHHQQVPKQELFLGSMATPTPTHTYNNTHKQLMNNSTNKQEMTTYHHHHLQAPPATTTTTNTTNPLCALSLLSSSSSPNMPLVNPLGLSLHDQTLDLHSHVDDDHSLVNNQSIHHPSIYTNMHMPSHASSHANQPTHPSLPFHWE